MHTGTNNIFFIINSSKVTETLKFLKLKLQKLKIFNFIFGAKIQISDLASFDKI